MLTAEVAMWSGVTWVISIVGGITAMVVGGVIATAAYLRQREIDIKQRLAVEEGVRLQTRAQEILADYEETGQGLVSGKPTGAASSPIFPYRLPKHWAGM